jgi:hypothetical protein
MQSPFSVLNQVGLSPVTATGDIAVAASTHRLALTDDESMKWFSPHNPLLWFGGILAVTLGFGAVSGSVRLGKAKVSASVGKSS